MTREQCRWRFLDVIFSLQIQASGRGCPFARPGPDRPIGIDWRRNITLDAPLNLPISEDPIIALDVSDDDVTRLNDAGNDIMFRRDLAISGKRHDYSGWDQRASVSMVWRDTSYR